MTLTERCWVPASEPALTQTYLSWLDGPEDYEQAYTVTLGPDGPAIIARVGTTAPLDGTPFQNHLRRHGFDGLWDAAFVTDAFSMTTPPYAPAESLDFDFAPSQIADALLRDSRGVLIWRHQLENFYALFGHGAEACIAFRKDINKNVFEAFEYAGQLEVEPGLSLRDVIETRMLFHGVTHPNLNAGHALLEMQSSFHRTV